LKTYPAIDVSEASPDLVLASVDDFAPTAAEERGPILRVFFSTAGARDAARSLLATRWHVTAIDVPDENWAERSQQSLTPVTVGRLRIVTRADWPEERAESTTATTSADRIDIIIQPSMGFGTGHHASTRLCLRALQEIDVTGKTVLDVGTGSGILAIAASRLGAASVLGVDNDPDALESAARNLALNPEASRTAFEQADLMMRPLPPADIVTANLTGVLLQRAATSLVAAIGSRGTLIVSGILTEERDTVRGCFEPASVIREMEEQGWLGMIVKR
jgi:ribosomal protein L11 methyltransferase